MFIDEKYRCSGIGRTLVEQFKEWSAEKGAGLLTVSAWVGNKHARDFYERWGFSEASVSYEMKC
jgi:GNAT superfamily N-acetyltransferase